MFIAVCKSRDNIVNVISNSDNEQAREALSSQDRPSTIPSPRQLKGISCKERRSQPECTYMYIAPA